MLITILSGKALIGLGAFLAGVGSLLSGLAALRTARRVEAMQSTKKEEDNENK